MKTEVVKQYYNSCNPNTIKVVTALSSEYGGKPYYLIFFSNERDQLIHGLNRNIELNKKQDLLKVFISTFNKIKIDIIELYEKIVKYEESKLIYDNSQNESFLTMLSIKETKIKRNFYLLEGNTLVIRKNIEADDFIFAIRFKNYIISNIESTLLSFKSKFQIDLMQGAFEVDFKTLISKTEESVSIEELKFLKTKKKTINKKKYFKDIFKEVNKYDKIIDLLIENKFIFKNNDGNFEWKGMIEDSRLKPLKLLCTLVVVLDIKNYLIGNLKNTEIASALTNTFSNHTVQNKYYGDVNKEIRERTANSKSFDYYNSYHFITQQ